MGRLSHFLVSLFVFLLVGTLVPLVGFWVKSILVFWVLMELQLFLIVGALANTNYIMSQVYFCVNSVAGMLMLMGSGINSSLAHPVDSDMVFGFGNHVGALIVFIGLAAKLGMVPFPFWVPYLTSVCWGLGNRTFFMGSLWLLVISKLLPLMGICHFSMMGSGVAGIIILNLYFSGLGMFLSSKFGEFLGWSSVGGSSLWVMIGWMNDILSLFCFIMYSCLLLWVLSNFNTISVLVLLFFLMGMPPVSFFMFKIAALLVLINTPVGGFMDQLAQEGIGGLGALLILSGFIVQILSYLYYISLFGGSLV